MNTVPAIAAQPQSKAWHSQSAEEVLGQLGYSQEALSQLRAERVI